MPHSIWQEIWKTQQWPQDWKRSVFIPIPKKGNAKECSNYTHYQGNTQNSPSQASTVREPRTSRCSSCIQKRQRNHIANCQHPLGHRKIKEIPKKKSTSASLTIPKPLTVWITINCGKFLKEMGIADHLTCLLRNLYAGQEATVRTGHKTTDCSKLGKEYDKAVYCHSAHLTCMQSISCEMLGWRKHKLESRLLGEISITSDMQMTPPLGQKGKKN